MEMERPIGYWLKHLDRLIETAAERTFAEEKLTRRHWQVVNILRESPRDAPALAMAIRPFWEPGAITMDEITGELADRGWLTRDDERRYTLTAAGQAGHAAVKQKVLGIRATLLTGLSKQDYPTRCTFSSAWPETWSARPDRIHQPPPRVESAFPRPRRASGCPS